MQHRNALKTTRQPSLIDVVSEGFAAANRRLWVLLIPIALDLFLWLGPRLGIAPLFAQVRELNTTTWDQAFESLGTDASTQIAAFDLRYLRLLNPVQSLLPLADVPAAPWSSTTWQIGSWSAMLGMVMLINAVALVFAVLYLLPLGQQIKTMPEQGARSIGRTLLAFAGVAALVLGVLFAASIVALVVIGLLSLVVQPLAMFVLFVWLTVVVWWVFVTSWAFDAVVLDGVGPVRAVWNSFLLVQRTLWGAINLWLLTTLITWGFAIIWQALATTGSIGLLFAIVGSAYITTGLVAAHLVFYRNRAAQPNTAQQPS
jgi:hypothetical protein